MLPKFILLSLTLFIFAGCQSKAEKEYKKQVDNINALKAAVAADQGAAIEFEKLGGTSTESYVVFKNTVTGEYMAYNLTKWNSDVMSTLAQYPADSNDVLRNMERKEEWVTTGHYEDIKQYEWVPDSQYDYTCSCYKDVSVYKEVVVGQQYIDDSGYYSFYYGGGFRFDNTTAGSKDLDTMKSIAESATAAGLAQKYKSSYSLSENRAQELADLSLKYMRMENTRELTPAEKDAFAVKALGVSMNQVEEAMKDRVLGQDDSYQALLKKAATINRTTPEMIGKFFDDLGVAE